jgi:uncharacterized protein
MCWKSEPALKARLPAINRAVFWIILAFGGIMVLEKAEAASFDCANAERDIEKLICTDQELNELDELAISYYQSAARTASGARHRLLQKSQRDWLQERDKCGGSTVRKCLFMRYTARLLRLEVQYGQGDATSPLTYRCGELEHEIDVSFFKTVPPAVSLSLGRANEPVTAILQPSDKGEKYVAADGLVFWASGEEASISLHDGKKAVCHLK